MRTYTATTQQSLFDIAVEVYGDVQAVFWLLADNPALTGLTDRLGAGQVLVLRPQRMNPRQVDYLRDFAPIRTISEEDRPTGIDYWELTEYIVQ